MPDKEGADKTPDIDVIVENINKSLDERFEAQKDGIKDVIDLAKKPEKKPEKDDFDTMFDDDDPEEKNYATKDDLKNLAKVIAKTVTKEARTISESVVEERTNKDVRDNQAFQDFPMLYKASPEYNKKFDESVRLEMREKGRRGRADNDPDLIYDSCATVYSRMVRSGEIVPINEAEKARQRASADGDNFSEFKGGKKRSNAPTTRQVELAEKMGLSKESLTQHMKNTQ